MKRFAVLAILLLAAPAISQDTGFSEELTPSVDSHVVEPGDTLWDLTARVFNDPFLWPRVWSYNPEITNPNWIYPGDIVRFYPSQEPLPSLGQGGYELASVEQEMPEEEEEPEEIADIEVIEAAPIRRRSEPARVKRFVGLFVTPKELEESGMLTNAVDDKMLFSSHDLVYLSFPKGNVPSPGDKYMVYRTLGEVLHPKSEKRWGYMTQVTGLASVQSVEKEVTRARLDHTVVEVERGQYVAPMKVGLLSDVKPKAATNKIQGVILTMQFDGGIVAGEHQIVFVDKGSNDGLERGDRLSVVSKGDPLTGRYDDMPYYEIAKLVVVQTNTTASTCLVVDSKREIQPGDTFFTVTQ